MIHHRQRNVLPRGSNHHTRVRELSRLVRNAEFGEQNATMNDHLALLVSISAPNVPIQKEITQGKAERLIFGLDIEQDV